MFTDINECDDKNATVQCSQICTNKEGGYSCSCKDGYFLFNGDPATVDKAELRKAIVDHTCIG